MERFEEKRVRERLSPNGSLPNSFVYTPLEDWTNDDVWFFLMQVRNPWGYNNKDLLTMYQGASEGGECPLVVDSEHAQLRRQPVRVLGVHACRKRQVDACDDPE